MTTIPESEMPAPRLELRWVDTPKDDRGYSVCCVYSLVLALDEHDIRAERDDGPDVREFKVELGKTLSDGQAARRYRAAHDEVDAPFRDGAHANWDTKQLGNLPVYAVAAGRAYLMKSREKLEQ